VAAAVSSVVWRRSHTVSAGSNGSCVSHGSLLCWGAPLANENSSFKPVTVDGPRLSIAQLTRANTHACVLTPEGEVWCAGGNADQELGAPSSDACTVGPTKYGATERQPCSKALQRVIGVPMAADVVAGYLRTCTVSRDGSVYCWGSKQEHRSRTPVPTSPSAISDVAQAYRLALGAFFTCALTANGTIQCWGSNQNGELGRGTRGEEIENSPAVVKGVAAAFDVGAGDNHACALTREGGAVRLACWGLNRNGQLGAPSECSEGVCPSPQNVTLPGELQNAAELAVGGDSTCLLSDGGALYCMGVVNGVSLGTSLTKITGIPPLTDAANGGTHLSMVTRNGDVLSLGAQLLDSDAHNLIKCETCVAPVTRVPGMHLEP
jgi:alpha-tubulin suppressor-like RCC1 family protein